MRRGLHFALSFAVIWVVAGCGEAPLKAPLPGRNAELDGGPAAALVFPSGEWTDDYGNLWKAAIADGRVEARGACGPNLGFVLAGDISDKRLDYRISTPDGAVLARGHADLINENHAFFDTRLPDGRLNAEGVLHFSHASPLRDLASALPVCAIERPPPAPGIEDDGNAIDPRPNQQPPAEDVQ